MWSIVRSVAGAIIGILLGNVIVAILQTVGMRMYPPPNTLDFADKAAVAEYLSGLPVGCFFWLLFGYAAGSFVGAYVAALIAGRWPLVLAGIVAAFFFAASIYNLFWNMPGHPTWFVIANLALFVPVALLAAYLARPQANVAGTTPPAVPS